MFFTKNRLFPGLYVVLMLISLVFIPFDAYFVSFVLPDEPMFDPETTKEFVRTLLAAAVWIPYMFMSRRVKNTFGPDQGESHAIS